MGCDIHMAIQYVWWTTDEGTEHYQTFGGSHFNPGRDYALFGCLAGVRDEEQEHISPRGQPEGGGWGNDVFGRYDEEGEFVSDDDLHNHTWLTCDEYAQALARRMLESGTTWPHELAYDVILITMKAFEEQGKKTRLLIAFDN